MAFLEPIKQVFLTMSTVLSGFLGKAIIAIVIVLLGFIMGRIIGRIARRFFQEIEVDAIAKKTAKIRFSIADILANVITWIIYFVTIVVALNRLCIGSSFCLGNTLIYVLVAGIIGFLMLSVFLSVKEFIPNFFAWLYLHQKRKLRVGNHIRYKDIEGEILQMGLLELKIRTKEGDLLFIPNANLTKEPLLKIMKKEAKKSIEKAMK